MKPFAEKIEELITVYGSQRKVARSLGVNQSTVSRILNERIKNPNINIQKKINRRITYYAEPDRRLYRYVVYYYSAREKTYRYAKTDLTEYRYLEDAYGELLLHLLQSDNMIQIIERQVISEKTSD
jgi:transcriptional regulator with XRE-family HTH domain